MLTVNHLTVAFGNPPLFKDAAFQILAGERVSLVGRNGSGKSTLLKTLAGLVDRESGEITLARGKKLYYLPQDVPTTLEGTVLDVVLSGLENSGLADWEADVQADRTIEEMELDPDAQMAELSAGMVRRVLLAKAVVSEPDLLLLDEPTNHLDIAAIQWMEVFLTQKFRNALLFVTHDRSFLQNVATRILDLERGQILSFDCDYRTYLERKDNWLNTLERDQANFDKKLAEEERWIRQGIKARRTRNEGRVRALEAMRRERKERRNATGKVRLELDIADRSGTKVIEVENLAYEYGPGEPVFSGFATLIRRKDRIGIVGPNGAGKSTLLKVLLGQLKPTSGTVNHGTNLEICFFEQLREGLNENKTVVEVVAGGNETVSINGKSRHVMSYLQDFLFAPDRARSPIKILSGGEKNRLMLAMLFARPSNLLVLDEPTNDLDLETLELLEDVLSDYPGTVMVVSHDRAFLDAVVTELYIVPGNGKIETFVGSFSDYVDKQKAKPVPAPNKSVPRQEPPKPAVPADQKPRKLLNRERDELERLPKEIEIMEGRHQALLATIADPATYSQGAERVQELEAERIKIEAKLEEKFTRWEALESLRNALEGSADLS